MHSRSAASAALAVFGRLPGQFFCPQIAQICADSEQKPNPLRLNHTTAAPSVGPLLHSADNSLPPGASNPARTRGADVVYFSYDRLPREITPAGFSAVAPNVVAEIVGHRQGWREAVEKTGEYLRMSVDRVWLIDAKTQRVHIYRPDVEPIALGPKDILTDDVVLPGFTCRVEELFSD